MNIVETTETLKKWVWSCETKEQLEVMGNFIVKFLTPEMFHLDAERLSAEIWELDWQIELRSNQLGYVSEINK